MFLSFETRKLSYFLVILVSSKLQKIEDKFISNNMNSSEFQFWRLIYTFRMCIYIDFNEIYQVKTVLLNESFNSADNDVLKRSHTLLIYSLFS